MLTGKKYRLKSFSVYLFFLLCFSCLYYRLFLLQIVNHEALLNRGLSLHRLNVKIDPRRGNIYDREGRPLAMSMRVKSAYAEPDKFASTEGAARSLARCLSLPYEQLLEKLNKKKKFVWLARKLDRNLADRIERLQIGGVGFREEVKRVYPQGGLLSHVLGFVDIDNRGLEGIELQEDQYLRGQSGWMASHRDRKGREIMTLRSQDIPPLDGYDLSLTMDAVIQYIAESELEKGCRQFNAAAGCLIVLNPKTGAVLALANWPAYDPNSPSDFPAEYRRNRCITDVYEPGSTFKVVTVAAALDRGCITMSDVLFCENGAFRVGRHTLHDVHPYGNLSTVEVIRKSSNIGAVKVAMRLGEEGLYRGIHRFGFGSPTGIGLPGEVGGMLHPLSRWSGLSIAAVPMGQELGVTPLQMAMAVAALANGGVAMRPYIIETVKDSSGRVVKSYSPEVRGRVVSEATAAALVSAMEGVPSREGTAPRAALEEYTVAGKTGTSQKVDPDGRYSHSRFVGSFVGFAPSKDPAALILVALDEPRPLYYGGTVAAPVFREVAKRVLKYLAIPPEKGDGGVKVVWDAPAARLSKGAAPEYAD
ncbi:MAG: penicillin-binding protein 2 [Candidatus Aureabacteria bacterium]|nr:penicillin-binding protein 2 [Candidatus Auribacterota bacterium]